MSSFAPKAASLNSLRDDSVVHWTQAWGLVLKNVVKLLLNFGKNKCSLFHEILLHPTHLATDILLQDIPRVSQEFLFKGQVPVYKSCHLPMFLMSGAQ